MRALVDHGASEVILEKTDRRGVDASIDVDKGLTFRMGQTHTRQHMARLLEHIVRKELVPESHAHRLPLSEAVRGYQLFDRKEEDCHKVVLDPAR